MNDIRHVTMFVYDGTRLIHSYVILIRDGEYWAAIIFVKRNFRNEAIVYQVIVDSLINSELNIKFPSFTRSLHKNIYELFQIL